MWRAYRAFRRGKKRSLAISEFECALLDNIVDLARALQTGTYRHGPYSHMIVNDNKRRDIAVAAVRDRVVHRLVYDYLVPIWDKTFIYDVWSCRPCKGLHAAIQRAQTQMRAYQDGWLWRADIVKFFDSVHKPSLKHIVERRVHDAEARWLIKTILDSYHTFDMARGIPIGNLTSQIFANIYLHEFDRFMLHTLKAPGYLRYGDDWLCFAPTRAQVTSMRQAATAFLAGQLGLVVHPQVETLCPVRNGIDYLGVRLWPTGRRLDMSVQYSMMTQLTAVNIASYMALGRQHQASKLARRLEWIMAGQLG